MTIRALLFACLSVAWVGCSDASDPARDLGVEKGAEPEKVISAALLEAREIGSQWKFVPPLKQEDTALYLTCGTFPDIKQTEVPTELARSAHFAGRQLPLVRPQLTEAIALFEHDGAERYMADMLGCKSRHTRTDLIDRGDETLTLYFMRDSDAFVENYIVIVRRGDAIMQLNYSIYQKDLSDEGFVRSLARDADNKFTAAVALLDER